MIIRNDCYNRDFMRHACPPDTWGKTYWAENTDNLTPDYLAAWAMEKVTGKACRVQRLPLSSQEEVADLSGDSKSQELLAPKYTVSQDAVKKVATRKARQQADITTIACVLKSGGDYDERYVANLFSMVNRNVTRRFRFVCLTDFPKLPDIDSVRLSNGLPGWWAKMDLFRPGLFDTERVLYFDLDTLVLANIDDMLALDDTFCGLRPWNKANREKGQTASGIMAARRAPQGRSGSASPRPG